MTWHYLSLRAAGIPGLPAWPAERIHLVGPRASCGWTLFGRTDDEGLYHDVAVTFDEAPDVDEAVGPAVLGVAGSRSRHRGTAAV